VSAFGVCWGVETLFLNDWALDAPWSNRGVEGVRSDFGISDADLDGARILIASYRLDGYEGAAFVLFERDGKLYEVFASHCSCYGLEGQWEPEEVTAAALRANLARGYDFDGCGDELARILDALEARVVT